MPVGLGWRRCTGCAAAAAALVLSVGGPASAGVLTPTTQRLGGTSLAVTTCGTTSTIVVAYAVKAGVIVGFTLSNIPSGCLTGQLSVTLAQGSTDVGHAGPTAISSTTMIMTPHILTTAAISPTAARISIVGP